MHMEMDKSLLKDNKQGALGGEDTAKHGTGGSVNGTMWRKASENELKCTPGKGKNPGVDKGFLAKHGDRELKKTF